MFWFFSEVAFHSHNLSKSVVILLVMNIHLFVNTYSLIIYVTWIDLPPSPRLIHIFPSPAHDCNKPRGKRGKNVINQLILRLTEP